MVCSLWAWGCWYAFNWFFLFGERVVVVFFSISFVVVLVGNHLGVGFCVYVLKGVSQTCLIYACAKIVKNFLFGILDFFTFSMGKWMG